MINTPRLSLHPLNLNELRLLVEAPDELALQLGMPLSPSLTNDETRDAVTTVLLPNMARPENDPLFWTLWTAIDTGTNCMAGGICFHGEPDAAGEVEIGYGTDEKFQGQGIMTEIVAGLIGWCRNQEKVRSIRAETDITNTASIRVLEKNHFTEISRTGTSVIHRLNLDRD